MHESVSNMLQDATSEKEKYAAMIDGAYKLESIAEKRCETVLQSRIRSLKGWITRESVRDAEEW